MIPPLTHEQLATAVQPEEVWKPEPSELFEGITNAEARDVITTIGVPVDFGHTQIFLHDDFRSGEPKTLSDIHQKAVANDESWDEPEGSEHWYVIADFYGEILIDGVSGRLWRTPEGFTAPEPFHDSIGSFVYFMYAIYRDRNLYSDDYANEIDEDPNDERDYVDACTEAAERLFAELRDVDPTPFTGAMPPSPGFNGFPGPWGGILEDIADGQWGSMEA